MFLKTLAQYAASVGGGIIGKTLFAYNMPETANLAVLLRQPLTGAQIDYELPGYRKTKFQVVARCKPTEIEQGHALIEGFVQKITLMQETSLAGYKVKFMRPRHDPIMYPISEGANMEFSVNFDVVYVIV